MLPMSQYSNGSFMKQKAHTTGIMETPLMSDVVTEQTKQLAQDSGLQQNDCFGRLSEAHGATLRDVF